jgi:hypothetical protein
MEAFHVRWIAVRSQSMWPALRVGDDAGFAVLSSPPSPGDVVLACTRRGVAIERVVRIDGERVTLRPDASWRSGPPIPLSTVMAVLRVVRRGSLQCPAPAQPPWFHAVRVVAPLVAAMQRTLRWRWARA